MTCDSDKVKLGQVSFSEDIGLTASQSCRENSCFSVCIHIMNDGIVTGDRPVLCCAALRRTRVVDECNASVCSFVVTSDSCPESSYLVLGVGPEWLLWLWALQRVFIIHREWIWSLKHSTPSRNRFDITAFQFSSLGLHRRCHNCKTVYRVLYRPEQKIRIKSGYPDLA